MRQGRGCSLSAAKCCFGCVRFRTAGSTHAVLADVAAWCFVLQGHLKKFKEEIQELGNKILQAALTLHERVSSTFRKTAVNFHYEVSWLIGGLLVLA